MQPKIRNLADVEAIEQAPLESLGLAENVYAAITEAAARYPNRVAIHGLSTGAADEEPASMTYADFLDALHRTANLFGRLGVGAELLPWRGGRGRGGRVYGRGGHAGGGCLRGGEGGGYGGLDGGVEVGGGRVAGGGIPARDQE